MRQSLWLVESRREEIVIGIFRAIAADQFGALFACAPRPRAAHRGIATMKLRSVVGSLALICACSSTDGDDSPAGTGGMSYGTGGVPATGGQSTSTGGVVTSTGGAVTSTGGVSTAGAGGGPSGGSTSTGGFPTGGAATGGIAGTGAAPASGGAPATGGAPVGTGGTAGTPSAGCQGLTIAPTDNYGAMGPYGAQTINNTGPNGQYTMVRPQKLGEGGTKHPIATWGNGITTTPALYPGLLNTIASHGFVVIASNNTNVTAALMTQGLDWLIQQNASGDLAGKLETKCAVTIGYSLGGGAAVGSGSHADVKATVSFHGLQGPAQNLQGPLLLFTSTADGFVTKANYVEPCYRASTKQPTIMATLNVPGAAADFAGHLYPLGDAGEQRAPAVAWLRLWVYGDQGARKYFYGSDCLLCKSPWIDIQRKNATF
jgi:dienelactone hydrolase